MYSVEIVGISRWKCSSRSCPGFIRQASGVPGPRPAGRDSKLRWCEMCGTVNSVRIQHAPRHATVMETCTFQWRKSPDCGKPTSIASYRFWPAGEENLAVHDFRNFQFAVFVNRRVSSFRLHLPPADDCDRFGELLHFAGESLVLPDVEIDTLLPRGVICTCRRIVMREGQFAD